MQFVVHCDYKAPKNFQISVRIWRVCFSLFENISLKSSERYLQCKSWLELVFLRSEVRERLRKSNVLAAPKKV